MPLHPLVKKAIENESIIEDSWCGFANKIIPHDAAKVQRIEMRKAYYCGFFAAFCMMVEVSAEVPEDQAEKILSNINDNCQKEIKKFADFQSLK